MILSATVEIKSDGKLEYKAHISDFDTQIGEATEIQYTTYKQVHKAFEEAVNEVNDRLAKEGVTDKLATLEL